jgi:hypothetical protein
MGSLDGAPDNVDLASGLKSEAAKPARGAATLLCTKQKFIKRHDQIFPSPDEKS